MTIRFFLRMRAKIGQAMMISVSLADMKMGIEKETVDFFVEACEKQTSNGKCSECAMMQKGSGG